MAKKLQKNVIEIEAPPVNPIEWRVCKVVDGSLEPTDFTVTAQLWFAARQLAAETCGVSIDLVDVIPVNACEGTDGKETEVHDKGT